MKKEESRILNVCISLCVVIACFLLLENCQVERNVKSVTQSVKKIEKVFGFDKSQYTFDTYNLGFNQNLGDLLLYEGISWDSIVKLDKVSADIFSIRKFRAKKPFTMVRKDSCDSPMCIIYEPNKLTYVKYFIKDKVDVDVVKRDYEIVESSASGIIETSLWNAMMDSDLDIDIIDKMEDALASGVDFWHVEKGDQFRLLYEKKCIDGRQVANGDVLAASYKDKRGEHFAIYYANENYEGFYDLKGNPTKGAFLRSPLKHSRISSRYNLRRFHPIKKRRIPHLGTDYAAPAGTPIFAVADGVIEKAGFTRNNGFYVKIRHDNVYKTQYLHMRKIGKGIKRGVRVKQSQVIGEVGQTGLATGPHVCYRFWKHGKQVNHLRENFPPADPLPEAQMPDFLEQRDILLRELSDIPYPNKGEEEFATVVEALEK